ncbi:MAG: hypothetical protein IT377_20180, partial [Polyangiaceae bacterium]|nr:hypothetical protein [Polyangiaceae bacterium]
MSIRIDNRFGTSASRAPGAKSEPQPVGLAAAVAKYEQDFRQSIEADHKAAEVLLGEAKKLDEEAKALRA